MFAFNVIGFLKGVTSNTTTKRCNKQYYCFILPQDACKNITDIMKYHHS